MINYLTNEQIDKSRWDDCVAHAVNGNVYAFSWYLDIVHPGWEALVEMIDGNYVTIMPISPLRGGKLLRPLRPPHLKRARHPHRLLRTL